MSIVKVRKGKDNLQFRQIFCDFCKNILIKTIENVELDYLSPCVLVDCSVCHERFSIKYFKDSIDIVHIKKDRNIKIVL